MLIAREQQICKTKDNHLLIVMAAFADEASLPCLAFFCENNKLLLPKLQILYCFRFTSGFSTS